jgi:hypothetical protein
MSGTFKTFPKEPLVKVGDIGDNYPHLPILMAIAHEGGSIFDYEKPESPDKGLDVTNLIKRLRTLSPQQFISTSGLRPGPKANQMYRDLLKSVLTERRSDLYDQLYADPETYDQHCALWYHAVGKLIGRLPAGNPFMNSRYDERSLKALKAKPEEFDLEDYQHLMGSMTPGTGYFTKNTLDQLFFTDAFAMLETCQDKAKTIKAITAKARYWAAYSGINPTRQEDMAEQLLSNALILHPEHFKQAGCGIRNLVGLEDLPTTHRRELDKDIFAGPLTLFSRSKLQGNKYFGLSQLFTSLQHLEPTLSIETMVELRGFANKRLVDLVESLGGHHPAIEAALAEGTIPEKEASPFLLMIKRKNMYVAYQIGSLMALLRPIINTLNRFEPVNPDDDSAQAPSTPINNKTQLKWIRDEHFVPAFAKAAGLKKAVIAYLEALEGVTPDHLMLIGVSGADVPQIVKKMPLKAQGALFSTDLGL